MYEYEGIVKRVIDGDTMEIEIDLGFKIKFSVTVRVLGIDTPEIFRPSCLDEKGHGMEATRVAKELLLNRAVKLQTQKGKRGKYGRYLASLFIPITKETGTSYEDYAVIMKQRGFEKKETYED